MNTETLPPPTFGEWLQDQLDTRGWSRPRLAREIDYSPGAVAAWVTGARTPEERACDAIALALDVDHNEVRRRANRPESTRSHFVPITTRPAAVTVTTSRDVAARPVDVVYLPVMGVAAADTLREFWGSGDLYPVSRHQVQGVADPVLFVVSGDCMEPRIHDGDLVVLDRMAEPVEGNVVAVRVGDDVTLKEYWTDNDEVVLRAVSAGYAPIRIKRSDQGAALVGVARAWFRSGRL